ncbi:MAG: hypothetical protein ACI97A_003669 [Planctomycetota bacterium]|jgi:hypothetical protein
MNRFSLHFLSVIIAALFISGCGGSDDNDYSNITERELSGSIELTDDDIDKYIGAIKDIRTTGKEFDQQPDLTAAMTASGKVKEAINKHGLTQNRFMAIQVAISRAFSAKMHKEASGAMGANEKMIEQLANTPGITAEQIAEMRKNMKKAKESAAKQAAEVPDGNIELINRRLADITAATK